MKILSSLLFSCLAYGTATFGPANQQPITLTDGWTGQPQSRPNIVFILTDDQDLHLNSIEYMPFLKKHLIEHGTFYKRHFCTTALCCPSRTTIFTGKNAHNTNVTNVVPPYGMKTQTEVPNPANLS